MKMGTLVINADMDILEAKRVLQRLQYAFDECEKNWDYLVDYILESKENAKKLDCQYLEKVCILSDLETFEQRVFVDYCRN